MIVAVHFVVSSFIECFGKMIETVYVLFNCLVNMKRNLIAVQLRKKEAYLKNILYICKII